MRINTIVINREKLIRYTYIAYVKREEKKRQRKSVCVCIHMHACIGCSKWKNCTNLSWKTTHSNCNFFHWKPSELWVAEEYGTAASIVVLPKVYHVDLFWLYRVENLLALTARISNKRNSGRLWSWQEHPGSHIFHIYFGVFLEFIRNFRLKISSCIFSLGTSCNIHVKFDNEKSCMIKCIHSIR